MALVNRSGEPVAGEKLRVSCYGVDPQLLQCVRRDDGEGIAKAIAAQPQMLWKYGTRLLLIAAVRGRARSAEALLRLGVEANAVEMLPGDEAHIQGLSELRITPLCAALARNREAVVQLLVAEGAQYDIFTAAFVGDLKAVQELLERTPELANANDPSCDLARITPLMHAVLAEHLDVARLLLERGATVGINSVRLIRAAANAGNEPLTDLLLEHGADPTALGAGRWVTHPALAEKLLARGANVNHKPGAWIGLCCTGNSGHKENPVLARSLLRCGADVMARYYGRTALHCAATAGFVHVVEALIEYGGDVNAPDERGRTPLDAVEEAAKSIQREPVRLLLLAHNAHQSEPMQ
jgi:ankyrin repeat protein